MKYSFIRKIFHVFLLLLFIGTTLNCLTAEAKGGSKKGSKTARKLKPISPKAAESLVGKRAIETNLMKRAAEPIPKPPKKKKGPTIDDIMRKMKS